jgi:hypothetical protein
MRAFYWIVGALASAAGGAYIIHRRRAHRSAQRRFFDAFLAAIRTETVVVETYEPTVASGFRLEAFGGVIGRIPGDPASGIPFFFAARTEASGTKWTFTIGWRGVQAEVDWNPLSGESEHPLKHAYDILRRSSSKDDGLSN